MAWKPRRLESGRHFAGGSIIGALPRTPNAIRPWLCAAAILVAVLYGYGLDHAPMYLDGDEAHFGIQAYSLAHAGRDLAGHFLPVFVNLWDPLGDSKPQEQNDARRRVWYQPFLFYLIALVLKVRPLSEGSIRIPTAIIGGLINPILVYGIGVRVVQRRSFAAAAALLVAASPAHFILAREALDYICPLPFVLVWLWCVVTYVEGGSDWLPAIGGLALGVGVFTFIASWILMPLYLATSWVAYALAGRDARRATLRATAAFLVPIALAAPWIWTHPEVLRDIAARYLASAGSGIKLSVLRDKVGEYWDYFNPAYLFLSGGVSLTTSTGRAGILPLAAAVLLPLGLYDLITREVSPAIRAALLAGLLIAPVPATLFGERYMVQRELVVVPFAALLATFGLAWLARQRCKAVRWLAPLLVAAAGAQFVAVHRDYFTHYQRRAAFWYDPVTIRGAVQPIVSAVGRGEMPAVYLSRALDDGGPKWRFYMAKHDCVDLLSRTRYFDEPSELAAAPPGAYAIVYANPRPDALLADGRWTITTLVRDVDDRDASIVLRKAHQ